MDGAQFVFDDTNAAKIASLSSSQTSSCLSASSSRVQATLITRLNGRTGSWHDILATAAPLQDALSFAVEFSDKHIGVPGEHIGPSSSPSNETANMIWTPEPFLFRPGVVRPSTYSPFCYLSPWSHFSTFLPLHFHYLLGNTVNYSLELIQEKPREFTLELLSIAQKQTDFIRAMYRQQTIEIDGWQDDEQKERDQLIDFLTSYQRFDDPNNSTEKFYIQVDPPTGLRSVRPLWSWAPT